MPFQVKWVLLDALMELQLVPDIDKMGHKAKGGMVEVALYLNEKEG